MPDLASKRNSKLTDRSSRSRIHSHRSGMAPGAMVWPESVAAEPCAPPCPSDSEAGRASPTTVKKVQQKCKESAAEAPNSMVDCRASARGLGPRRRGRPGPAFASSLWCENVARKRTCRRVSVFFANFIFHKWHFDRIAMDKTILADENKKFEPADATYGPCRRI